MPFNRFCFSGFCFGGFYFSGFYLIPQNVGNADDELK